jgi:hypothetical protein
MTLEEVLKAESLKNAGKPLSLDAVKVLMNVSGEEWMNALIALTLSGCCVLSSATGSDGNSSISMVQYIPSFVDDTATAIQREPVVKAGAKSATRGRPKVSPELKRVVINHVRLPLWLSEHLKDRGNSGRTVEQAVIKYLGLVAPSG